MLLFIIILAIVQGLTEFLPVSSSGHLVLLNKFFGIESDFLLLSVILHVATLLSVIVILRKEVLFIIKHPFSDLSKKLICATIPTVIIALLFKNFFDSTFDGKYLPICFMITAVLIVVSEIINKTIKSKKLDYKTSVFMGLVQGIAILPGISRSGSTICAGLLNGVKKDELANFSFLMSIPIILGSLILEVYDYISVGQTISIAWYELVIGFIVAFITGIFAIKFMINLIKKHSIILFAIYLVLLSIISFFVI